MTFPSARIGRLTRLVAGHGLETESPSLIRDPLGAQEWTELVTSIQLQRLTGLLAAAIADESLPATASQRHEANDLHAAMVGSCLRLERDLLWASALFAEQGIDLRILKGPSFALLDYAHPALRMFGDIDILVRSEDFDHAVEVLSERGYVRHYAELRPGFDRRFGKGASLTGPNGREIDLHRTLAMGPFGLSIALDDLWGSSTVVEVGGQRLQALDEVHRFVHACYHASIGKREPLLVPLRDVAGMLTTDPDLLPSAISVARRWRAEVLLARAISLAWERLELRPTPASQWARARPSSAREQRALRAYLQPDVGFAARQFAAIRSVRGLRSKAQYVSALAVPSFGYGSGRHSGHAARWREAARQTLTWLKGPGQ